MRISGDFRITKGYGSVNTRTEHTAVASSKGKDKVVFSKEALDIQTAKKALANVPDINEQKVTQLVQQFQGGTYSVSGYDVADKLVNEFFNKKI